MTEVDPLVVDMSRAAELIGVSKSTLDQWHAQGMPKEKKGVNIHRLWEWRYEKLKAEIAEESGKPDYYKEQAGLIRSKRKLADMDVKLRQGEIVEVEKVMKYMQKTHGSVKQKLLGMGTKLAAKLTPDRINETKRIIDIESENICKELSREFMVGAESVVDSPAEIDSKPVERRVRSVKPRIKRRAGEVGDVKG